MKINFLNVLMALSLTSVGVSAATKPIFYPAAPEQPRVQFLKAMNGPSFFVAGNGYGNRFPGLEIKGKEVDGIAKPYGITTTQGKIFVCDTGAAVVKVFDLEKKFVTKIGDQKLGKLSLPLNIAVDADGTRYVADGEQSKIFVYNANNVFQRTIGNPEKMKPTDIVINHGNLYVTDVKNSQIVIIDPKTGAELSRFSQAGVEPQDLLKATNLTVDNAGNIITADTLAGKVSMFGEDGKFIKVVGSIGDQLGHFARPKGLAVDHENRLFAIDAAFENLQIFNEEGKLLMPFGEVGNVPGGLNMPVKVAVDYANVKYFKDSVAPGFALDYLILVTNQFGDNKVNVYGMLKKL